MTAADGLAANTKISGFIVFIQELSDVKEWRLSLPSFPTDKLA
jgi:hypothetical protein